jgi:hypothetical protein
MSSGLDYMTARANIITWRSVDEWRADEMGFLASRCAERTCSRRYTGGISSLALSEHTLLPFRLPLPSLSLSPCSSLACLQARDSSKCRFYWADATRGLLGTCVVRPYDEDEMPAKGEESHAVQALQAREKTVVKDINHHNW